MTLGTINRARWVASVAVLTMTALVAVFCQVPPADAWWLRVFLLGSLVAAAMLAPLEQSLATWSKPR